MSDTTTTTPAEAAEAAHRAAEAAESNPTRATKGAATKAAKAAIAILTEHGWDADDLKGRDAEGWAAVWEDATEEQEEESTVAKRMTATLNAYKPRYVKTQTASGTASQCCGDELAMALSGLTPEEVAAAAEKLLELGSGFLWAGDGTGKYDSLNPGQVRMNSGNRIRAAIKRKDVTTDEAMAAIAG